jgi:hypothetical protein
MQVGPLIFSTTTVRSFLSCQVHPEKELPMKDLALVGPILVVGATLLVSVNWSTSQPNLSLTQELVFLAFLLGLLFAWHRGKQSAAERLKAIELGWDVSEGLPSSSLNRSAVAVGLGTPVSLVGLASMASSSRPELASPIWFSACLLGMTTLICGTILLLRHPAGSSPRESGRPRAIVVKTKADPDEFDVAGQRGSNGHPPEERS